MIQTLFFFFWWLPLNLMFWCSSTLWCASMSYNSYGCIVVYDSLLISHSLIWRKLTGVIDRYLCTFSTELISPFHIFAMSFFISPSYILKEQIHDHNILGKQNIYIQRNWIRPICITLHKKINPNWIKGFIMESDFLKLLEEYWQNPTKI